MLSKATEIAGDILAAATALAGLLLVFIGAVAAGFDSYRTDEKSSVRARFRRRAWLGFAGFVLSIASAVSALASKWLDSFCLSEIAAALLIVGFIIVVIAAVRTVLDID